jgi:DHA2 family multidrug resistance protein-like MFS transporter
MTVVAERAVVRATAGTKEWLGLVVLAFAVLLIAIDATVLDVALPFISADLQPTAPQLLWIIDVYSFVLAGLLITMGTLGDRIGRRRLLLIGAAGFGIASAIAGVAVSPEMLIAARALQGVAGATLMPATLGLIRAIFTDPRQRTTAIAVWAAMAGGGAAIGPLVGGWLLEHFWWGSVFLVNLPLMLALIVFGPMVIPEARDPRPGKFDIPSAALSMLAVLPIVYAIKEIAVHGPSLVTGVAALVGVPAGAVFVTRQRQLADPMLDLSLFGNRAFRMAVTTDFLSVFALSGLLFFGAQYLQVVAGLSPLDAGLAMLPGTATSVVASIAAAWLLRRWRTGPVLAAAVATSALGSAILLAISADGSISAFVVGFVLVGAGVGTALTVTSDIVVSAVAPARAGAASAVAETAYELGAAAGVAVLGSVVLAVFRGGLDVSGLTPEQAATSETLGGAAGVAGELGNPTWFVSAMHDAFVGGMHVAAAITAVVLAIAALRAIRLR